MISSSLGQTQQGVIFLFFSNLFYFWLHWVFVAVCRLLVAVSGGYSSLRCTAFSLRWLLLLQSTGSGCAGFSSCGSRALECRLSSCGARAQLLHGMWDLPGPGLKPVSPALAGGFLTTAPPGKPFFFFYFVIFLDIYWVGQKAHSGFSVRWKNPNELFGQSNTSLYWVPHLVVNAKIQYKLTCHSERSLADTFWGTTWPEHTSEPKGLQVHQASDPGN